MKAMMMSIRPQWISKILNKEKTIEIRKRFPKDYVGWVYIYCTKEQGLVFDSEGKGLVNSKLFPYAKNCPEHNRLVNGKVVARFWCDKVEEIKWDYESPALSKYVTHDLDEWELCNKSCLTGQELIDYLGKENRGYAIRITNLEIFYKPKALNEFGTLTNKCNGFRGGLKPLTKAPQSWCYIEV